MTPHRAHRIRVLFCVCGMLACAANVGPCPAEDTRDKLSERAQAAMRKAATFYREQVAVNGGYVYYYSPDLSRRLGEGVARPDQIWVQAPGTPTVGQAYLNAYDATGDEFYRDAAVETAEALIYGQLQSGGWQNSIEFDPRRGRNLYRNGRGGGERNFSSLDDGITQNALAFLIQLDQATDFEHDGIHEAVQYALDALLNAQFPGGGFPQGWEEPVDQTLPLLKANYPDHDWRTEGRIKEYWNLYTLNDGVAPTVFRTLKRADEVYGGEKYRQAIVRLGDFLILAQMPHPQPGWAQQYNYEMQPVWARQFEPPAISGLESQDVMLTLIEVARLTGEEKYLEPIPRALAYFRESLLPDGRLARYYELHSNRPLYMQRRGSDYSLTYSDANLPGHYGWKCESRLSDIERQLEAAPADKQAASARPVETPPRRGEALQVIESLDDKGRWVSTHRGEALVGQPKFRPGDKYLSSAVFSANLTTLSDYLEAARDSYSTK